MNEQKRFIYVTTFYSPGLLWFIYAGDIQKRQRYSDAINNVTEFRLLQDYEVGQRIIVQYKSMWARAELVAINIIDDEIPTTEFVCWMSDYGVFRIIYNEIYEMPQDMELYPSFIKKGIMHGMIPCVMEPDFETGRIIKIHEHWFAPAIRRNICNLLTEIGCAQLFVLRYEYNGYEIGDIFTSGANGEETNLSTCIMDWGLADYNEHVFQSERLKRTENESLLVNVYKAMSISDYNNYSDNPIEEREDTGLQSNESTSNAIENESSSNSNADNHITKVPINDMRHATESQLSTRSEQIQYLRSLINKRTRLSRANADQNQDIVDEVQFADAPNDSQTPSNAGNTSDPANISKELEHLSLNPIELSPSQHFLKQEIDEINQMPSSLGRGISRNCSGSGKMLDTNKCYIGRGYANMPIDLINPRPGAPACDMEMAIVRDELKENAAKAYKAVPFHCFPAGGNLSITNNSNNPIFSWCQNDNCYPENDTKNEHNQVATSSSGRIYDKQIANKDKLYKIRCCCHSETKSVSHDNPECDHSQSNQSENSESSGSVSRYNTQILNANLLKQNQSEFDKIEMQYKKQMDTENMHKSPVPRLLVHGMHAPSPVTNMETLPFNTEVQKTLSDLKLEQPNQLQTYVWPAVLRGENAIIIDRAKSGKTLSYASAICSLASKCSTTLSRKLNSVCPSVIIFCPDIEVVENVYNVIRKLICERNRVVMLVPPFGIEQQVELDKGVDILVCTPRLFARILKLRFIRLLRLNHIIIENGNEVYRLFTNEMEKILKLFHTIRRKSSTGMQLVLVAEEFTTSIETLALQLKRMPIVYIGSNLEAAHYGWVNTIFQFTGPQIKQFQVTELIKDQSTRFKTIVICNDLKKSTMLVEYLNIHGFTCILLNEQSKKNDIISAKCMWEYAIMGSYPVLVCTDSILNESLNINNADIVIQYNLPNSWEQFVYRYSSFTDNYLSPIFTEKGEKEHHLRMYVFLDETNLTLFPRVINHFVKKNTTLQANLLARFTDALYEIDRQKLEEEVKLCPNIMMFGDCDSQVTCLNRHILFPDVDLSKTLPKNCFVKMELLHIHNVGRLSAQITEYVDCAGNVHPMEDRYSEIQAELKKIASNPNKTKAFDVGVDSIAAVETWRNDMQRCKVVRVLTGTSEQPQMVVAKLLDIGFEITIAIDKLYMIPITLKRIPPQATEVYLAGLAPPDLDKIWSTESRSQFRAEVLKSSHQNYTGKVVLQLGKAIYVENLKQTDENDSACNIKSLKEYLLTENLAEENRAIMTRLYQLCDKSGNKVLRRGQK